LRIDGRRSCFVPANLFFKAPPRPILGWTIRTEIRHQGRRTEGRWGFDVEDLNRRAPTIEFLSGGQGWAVEPWGGTFRGSAEIPRSGTRNSFAGRGGQATGFSIVPSPWRLFFVEAGRFMKTGLWAVGPGIGGLGSCRSRDRPAPKGLIPNGLRLETGHL